MKTEFNFDELQQLSNTNYERFSEGRRTLIARFLEKPGREISELRSLQDEIDLIRASQCAPSKAIDGIAALIAPRIRALQQLTEALLSLQRSSENPPSTSHTKRN
jgi:hypothetical protein